MSDIESSKIAHIIFNLVNTLAQSYGVTTLAKILTGRSSKTIVRKKLHENENFGILSDYSYKQVLVFLDLLIADGYLERGDVGEGEEIIIVIKLTEKGLTALKNCEVVRFSVPHRYDADFTSAHDF